MTANFHESSRSLLTAEPTVAATALAAINIVLSEPMRVDISVYRGDSGQFRITVTDPGGAPANLAGATWDGDIRAKLGDAIVMANFEMALVDGDSSSVDVTLTAAESEKLISNGVYDIEMTLAGNVTTLIFGDLKVTQDVSRP